MGVVDDRATPGDSARMQVDGVVFGERNFGGLPARSMCRGVCRSRRGGVRLVRRRDAQKVSKGSSESFEGTKSSGGSKGLGLRDPGKGSRVPRNRGEGRGGPKVKGLLDTNSYPKSPRGLWGPRGRRIVASDLRRLRLQQALGRELNLRLASPNLAQIRNIARGARRKSSVLLRVPKLLQQQRRSPLRGKLSRIGAQVAINIMCGFHRRNARLTAEQIAVVLNRASEQWPAMADVKFLLQVGSALNPGVVGTRVSIFGKVGAGTQTKVYAVACGNSAPDYDPAGRLTYGFAPAETYTGTFGIHVWLRSS